MTLQLESQALLREFVRRLKEALRSAPNHVRMEAAMEVESHVLDVLARRPGEGPEHEQVARILAGFGSPEEYAAALLSQMPAASVVSVSSGVREVGMAGMDLVRGTGRLLLAVLRGAVGLVLAALRQVWRAVRWLAGRVSSVADRSRPTLARAAAWVGRRLGAGGRLVARVARFFGGILAEGWRRTARGAGMAARNSRSLAYRGADLGMKGFRLLKNMVVWTLKAAGLAALAVLTLMTLGLAGFVALAPDIGGWWVFRFNQEVGIMLDDLRQATVARTDLATQAQFEQTGLLMLGVLVLVSLGLASVWAGLIWSARRKRQTVSNP